jgi:DNA-binding transcriptional LysR family regulator
LLNNLDTPTLRTFVILSETGSFSETAKKLLRTQPAISQQIKKLENATNHKLFHRQKNAVVLTRQGEALLKYAQVIVELSDRAHLCMQQQEPTQEVRLGAPDDYASILLADVLSKFQISYPKASLSITCSNSRDLISQWELGKLDICVVATDQGIDIGTTLRIETLVWIAGRDWKRRTDPLPLSGFPRGCHVRDAMEAALDAIDCPWRTVFSSNSITAIRSNVASLGSITAVERSLVPDDAIILGERDGLPMLPNLRIALLERCDKASLFRDKLVATIQRDIGQVEPAPKTTRPIVRRP